MIYQIRNARLMDDIKPVIERVQCKKNDYQVYNFTETENDATKTFYDLAREFDTFENFHQLSVAMPKFFFTSMQDSIVSMRSIITLCSFECLFRVTAEEIPALRSAYALRDYHGRNECLRQVITKIAEGQFSPETPDLFRPFLDPLFGEDCFFVWPDHASSICSGGGAVGFYTDENGWTKMAILNVARHGKSSSVHAIRNMRKNLGYSPHSTVITISSSNDTTWHI